MTREFPRGLVRIVAATSLLVLAGLAQANKVVRQPTPISAPDSALSTRCIGRYLIDLPADLLTEGGGQMIDEVKLSVKPATAAEFRKALAKRTAELNTAFTSRKGVQYPVLRKKMPLPVGLEGVLFDAAKPESVSGRMARVLEVLAWRDGYLITAAVDAVDTTFPEEKDNETLHAHVKTNVAEKTMLILDVVSRTSGRADREIPTQQGVCIGHGFVRGAPTAGESITGIYQFAKIDHFFMRVNSSSLSRGKNTLLDRIEKTRRLIKNAKGKVFRETKRNVDGMNGYEVAYSMLNDKDQELEDTMVDQFIFELNSAEGSKRKPRLRVEAHNGVMLRDFEETDDGSEPAASVPRLRGATLSTPALERMWDKIIPTIRARPNAF